MLANVCFVPKADVLMHKKSCAGLRAGNQFLPAGCSNLAPFLFLLFLRRFGARFSGARLVMAPAPTPDPTAPPVTPPTAFPVLPPTSPEIVSAIVVVLINPAAIHDNKVNFFTIQTLDILHLLA
jgi:hypothetical protein